MRENFQMSYQLNSLQKALLLCSPAILATLILANIALFTLLYFTGKDLRSQYASFFATSNTPTFYPLGVDSDQFDDPVGRYVQAPYGIHIRDELNKKECIESDRQLLHEKQSLDYDYLYDTAKKVVDRIPEIKSKHSVVQLIVETAIAETHGGLNFDAKNYGGLGITQMNYNTVQEMLANLSKTKPHIHKAIELFRDENLSLRENIIYNLDYNMALCIGYYYYRKGDNLYNLVNTKHDRANLWKEAYNTYLGKGTPEIYKARVTKYKKDAK